MKKDTKSLRDKYKSKALSMTKKDIERFLNQQQEPALQVYHEISPARFMENKYGRARHEMSYDEAKKEEEKYERTKVGSVSKKLGEIAISGFPYLPDKLVYTKDGILSMIEIYIQKLKAFQQLASSLFRDLKMTSKYLPKVAQSINNLSSLKQKVQQTTLSKPRKIGWDIGGADEPYDIETHTVTDCWETSEGCSEFGRDYRKIDLEKQRKWGLKPRMSVRITDVIHNLSGNSPSQLLNIAEQLDLSCLPGGTIYIIDSVSNLNKLLPYFQKQAGKFIISRKKLRRDGTDSSGNEDEVTIRKKK